MTRQSSVLGTDQGRRRTALGFLLLFVFFSTYVFLQSRPVEVPVEVLAALREYVGQERWDVSSVEATRRGQTYIINLVEETADGRRLSYGYEVDQNLQVTPTGMTAGVAGRNYGLLIILVIALAMILAWLVYSTLRRLMAPKCPVCGALLGSDTVTLFGGDVAIGGENLPAILLHHHTCESCGYERKAVEQDKGHRAGDLSVRHLTRPTQDASLDRIQDDFLKSRTMTYTAWQDMLRELKEQHEGEWRP